MPATTGNRVQLLLLGVVAALLVAAVAVVWLVNRDDTAAADPVPSPEPTASSATTPPDPSDPATGTPSASTTDVTESSAPATSFAAQPTGELEDPPVPQQTPEGAAEFLTWWFDMLNYVELTGRTELVEQNSLPDCAFCAGQVQAIDELYGAGGRIERDGNSTVSDLRPSPVDANGYVVIELESQDAARRILDAENRLQQRLDALPPRPFVVGLQWVDETWKVRELARASD